MRVLRALGTARREEPQGVRGRAVDPGRPGADGQRVHVVSEQDAGPWLGGQGRVEVEVAGSCGEQ